MHRAVYWLIVGMAVLAAGIVMCRLDPSKILFPTLLALFSFLSVWTTLDFQWWTRGVSMKRENPKPLFYLGARGLVSSASANPLIILVNNPGVLTGSLTAVKILRGIESESEVTWNWQFLHPIPSSNQQLIGSPPVPLLPGCLVALYTTVSVNRKKDARLGFSFRMGDYEERSTEWSITD